MITKEPVKNTCTKENLKHIFRRILKQTSRCTNSSNVDFTRYGNMEIIKELNGQDSVSLWWKEERVLKM